MNRRPSWLIRLSVTLALTGSVAGCYGPFALTRKLHAWNGTISDKWINSLVFFGFAVVQVYTLCLLGDGLIFNTVEFWSGSNPVVSVEPDGTVLVVKEGRSFRLVPTGDDRWIVEREGQVVAIASQLPSGGIALSDVSSTRTAMVDAAQVEELREGAALAMATSAPVAP